ncbi:MAG: histidine phosphatase family protein [Patulibacter minatonensis]
MAASAPVGTTPAVLLARHGETDDNAASRFQGVRNPPLNARGREQAAALAAELAVAEPAIREIWASPYARAQETAAIVAARLGLPVRTDPRIAESDVGDWSGATYAEVQGRDPAGFQAWVDGDPEHRFPGGESLAEVRARVELALADARAAAPTVLLVCHGGVIRSALRATGHAPRIAGNGEAVAL